MKFSNTAKSSQTRAGYLFLLPAIMVFIILRIIPAITVVYYSLTEFSIIKPPVWIGLNNYINLFGDKKFLLALENSLLFTVGTVLPSAVIGLFFALFLNKKIIGVGFYRAVYYMPQVVSWVAISMIWIYILNPSYGVINWFLSLVGIQKVQWLFNTDLALVSIIFVSIWRSIGYNVVIYLAGLQGLDESLYEAAEMDGCNSWQKIWFLTLPLLKPVTTYIIVVTSIFSLQAFDQIYVLTAGGPADSTVTAVFSVWRQAFQYGRMGYASAQSVVVFFLIAVITLLSLKISDRNSL